MATRSKKQRDNVPELTEPGSREILRFDWRGLLVFQLLLPFLAPLIVYFVASLQPAVTHPFARIFSGADLLLLGPLLFLSLDELLSKEPMVGESAAASSVAKGILLTARVFLVVQLMLYMGFKLLVLQHPFTLGSSAHPDYPIYVASATSLIGCFASLVFCWAVPRRLHQAILKEHWEQ